jgi:hypothetical protein
MFKRNERDIQDLLRFLQASLQDFTSMPYKIRGMTLFIERSVRCVNHAKAFIHKALRRAVVELYGGTLSVSPNACRELP